MIIFLTHPFLGGDISEYDTRGSVQELIAVQQIAPVGFFLHFLHNSFSIGTWGLRLQHGGVDKGEIEGLGLGAELELPAKAVAGVAIAMRRAFEVQT